MTKFDLDTLFLPLLESLGLILVETRSIQLRGCLSIELVLHKENGITVDDLLFAQKTLKPALEQKMGRDLFSLKISSPGTNRTFRDPKEYSIFKGQYISILVGQEWIKGRIEKYKDQVLTLLCGDKLKKHTLNQIKKAKLTLP